MIQSKGYIHNNRFVTCAVCGYGYRRSEIRMGVMPRQKGLCICPVCFDPMHPNEGWKLRARKEDLSKPYCATTENTDLLCVATPTMVDNSGIITLSSTTSGAFIYYTVDGSSPTYLSTLYTAPFDPPSGTTTIKARSYHPGAGYKPCDIMEESICSEMATTWTKHTTTSSPFEQHAYVLTHDSTSEIDIVGGTFGAATSPDGATWTVASPEPDATVHSLAYDITNDTVVAGTADAKIWTSANAGAAWTERYTAAGESEIFALTYDSTNSTLVAGSGGAAKVYTSTDGGTNWTNTATLADDDIVSMAYDSVSDIVIAGTSPLGKIYISEDSGANWTLKKTLSDETPAQTAIKSLAVDTYNMRMLAGTYPEAQLWISDDAGETWTLNYSWESSAATSVQAMCYSICGQLFVGLTGLAT